MHYLDLATVGVLFQRREAPLADFETQADAIAGACHAMAARFEAGGTLLVFGNGGPSTDAQHVAVEFVHPVIVGKRALPALSLTGDVATFTGVANTVGLAEVFAHQIRVLGRPGDIALGISTDGDCVNVAAGLTEARSRGLTTVALVGGDGGAIARDIRPDHVILASSHDPQVVKEVHVTAYHLLWELVHVFLERPTALNVVDPPTAVNPPTIQPGGAACATDGCVTCGDIAVEVTVVRLLADAMAAVDTGSGEEEVSVALVDARVGDVILVHAGEAITTIRR